jgi:hypothetical protein
VVIEDDRILLLNQDTDSGRSWSWNSSSSRTCHRWGSASGSVT